MMKVVYGLMTQNGDAQELLWDLGFWESEESAREYLSTEMSNTRGITVEPININDPIPVSPEEIEENEMVACSLCGIQYNREDVNMTDYDENVCVNCEPEYRENPNLHVI
ncbi:hypothetical protein [Bacillus sp. ISL-47]|uniref:hypothetical protein n=1 Tax=Bacillus sp. ISL-47 TaxID=2819130 RepID=UPI001BE8B352|nr:hypothetical protein [Bacillus sp. ISL-47]MBT2708751.1 hypothetical protein [Pseudomonas sp. ISL-84]